MTLRLTEEYEGTLQDFLLLLGGQVGALNPPRVAASSPRLVSKHLGVVHDRRSPPKSSASGVARTQHDYAICWLGLVWVRLLVDHGACPLPFYAGVEPLRDQNGARVFD